jgi:hypothetical protein
LGQGDVGGHREQFRIVGAVANDHRHSDRLRMVFEHVAQKSCFRRAVARVRGPQLPGQHAKPDNDHAKRRQRHR